MADGKIDIELEVKDSKAQSQGKKAGDQIAKGVEQGIKNVGKSADTAAKQTEKSFQSAANSAKSSFSDVGSAAKNSFGDVGDAAKNASDDASSAFEEIPADAEGAFSDVGSEAQSGFDGVADAAQSASGDAASAFQEIPADAQGAFSDVGDAAKSGFDSVPDAANSAAGDAASAFGQITTAADAAGDSVQESLGVKTIAAGNLAADAITAAAGKIADLGKNAIDSGMEFDAAMSQVAATMGVTKDEIGNLTQFAKHMGETTAFSASESAQALNYMALAGYDAETSMRVLPTVLNLAAAGSMDLARASDMVTDAQSALGLSVEEAEVMVDQMAKTSSKTNTSVEQLGDAFLTVGGTAKNLSGGTAELSQMLGLLADNGIKGAEGGTALRNVILSLSAPTDKAADSIKDLGLQVFDAEGNMRPMPDIFNDLNSAMAPLSQKDRTELLNNIFNKVDLKSVNALLGTSADRFDEVAGAIDNAQGSAQKMADTQLDNLAGDVTLLESATEGFYIAVSDALTPALRDLTQFGTNTLLPFLTSGVKSFDKWAPSVAVVAAAIVALGVKSKVFKTLANDQGIAAKAAKNLGLEFSTMTTKQKLAAVATNTLNGAMKALKSAAPILAITAVVEIATVLITKFKEAEERTKKFETATSGLEAAASGVAIAIDEETGAFDSLGSAVSKVDVDDLIDKHVELAKTIEDTKAATASSVALLDDYGSAIEQLADRSDLSEQEVAKLKLAVDQVNDSLGTSYEVVQDTDGVYRIMSDGVAVAKDEVLKLIDAQKIQMQLEAEMENYKAVYQQLQEDNEKLAQAKKNVKEATEKLEKAEADYYSSDPSKAPDEAKAAYDSAKKELEKYEGELKEVESVTGSAQSTTNKLTERVDLLKMATDESASSFIKAAANNMKYSSGVQAMDVDLVKFTQALEEMGFTSDQVSNMSQEDAMKLAGAWDKGYDEMQDATREVIGEVPEALRNMGAEAYNAAYGTGQQSGQGWADGLSSETQAAINAALEVTGMTIDEFINAANEAGVQGDEAVKNFADSIKAGEKQSQTAGKINSDSANKGFGSANTNSTGVKKGQEFFNGISAQLGLSQSAGVANSNAAKTGMGTADTKSVGVTKGQEFASGVSSKKGESEKSGKVDADAAKSGMKSQDGNASTWGSHLGGLFANGIRAAQNLVSGAANALAGIVKNILGHTVPKEGVLRNGGKGEKPWGEHLVMNIAEGMTSMRAQRAIRQATKAVAVDINDSLMREMMAIDPMAQLEESLAKGSAAFNMSAMMVGAAPSYTNNNQTVNFNGDIQSPDIIARNMRLQQHYGLAGKY